MLLALPAQAQQEAIAPPVAKTVADSTVVHGDTLIDNYRWMHEKKNPEVLNYLYAENGYRDRIMKSSQLMRKKLYEEMRSRQRETRSTIPIKKDNYYYYTRYEKGSQYAIHCRKKDSLSAPEEIILDVNKLAKELNYAAIQFTQVSPDHNLLAFCVNTAGGDAGTLYIKDLSADTMLTDKIKHVRSMVWANDNQTIFYHAEDPKTKRGDKVYRHSLGTPFQEDKLIYHETRKAYFTSVSKSSSEQYIFISSGSFTSGQTWFLNADNPTETPVLFEKEAPEVIYGLDHYHGDEFYLSTNWKAPNYCIMKAPVSSSSKAEWQIVVPHSDSANVEQGMLFKDFLVVQKLVSGRYVIEIINRHDSSRSELELKEAASVTGILHSYDYEEQKFMYYYSSLTTPALYKEYDLVTGGDSLLRMDTVIGYDAAGYVSERIWAVADDGKKVPVDIVYKKGLKKDGSNPLYLYGYGCYGNNIQPSFRRNVISYLDRGFVFAIAHVRGESFLGKQWHDDGKLLNKKNTFTDFIACTEHLIEEGYTSKGKVAIEGGSAGGLLMGAVATIRPDLYSAVIAAVPFVDVLNDMLDPSWPDIAAHYEEIGNPNIREHYDYIKSYCPYQNVSRQNYPNLLVTSGYNDSRVPYWAASKWVAKLRAHKTDSNLLLLSTNMDAGHFGSSGRYDYLKEKALEMAFVFRSLGITENYISIRGKVEDVSGEPMPYVNVYVNGTTNGTSTNPNGEFLIEVRQNQPLEVVFQTIGYKKHVEKLDMDTETRGLEVVLESEDMQLPVVSVSASGKDPAYAIIKKAMEKRKFHLNRVQAYSGDIYIKGTDRLDEVPEKFPKFLTGAELPDSNDLGLLYLSESVARFHFQKPDNYKEEMFASKVAGRSQGFSWNRVEDVLFNFYENSIDFPYYSQREFISPIASTAMFYYKYKYEGSYFDNGRQIDKIKVIPRRNSDPVFHGHIYIVEDDWAIQSLDLMLTKAAQIEFVDTIYFEQSYVPVDDSVWMPLSLKINSKFKIFGFGGNSTSVGIFSNYRLNRDFPKKFFNNEVFKIEDGANEQDSGYWETSRPLLLTEEEKKNYAKSDSLEIVKKSKPYLDSLDHKYNKPTIGKLLVSGYSYRNRYDSTYYNFNPLLFMFGYNTVEGLTIEAKPYLLKQYSGHRYLRIRPSIRYGFENRQLNAKLQVFAIPKIKKFLRVIVEGGKYISQFNESEPISLFMNSVYTLLAEQNFMKLYNKVYGKARYMRELVNGVYINSGVEYAHRSPLGNTGDYTFVDYPDRQFAPNIPGPGFPRAHFDPHNALLVDMDIRLRFKQKYESVGERKFITGSKYPTVYAGYRKGIPVLGASADFDFIHAGIGDDVSMKNFGVSKYDVTVGTFLSKGNLQFMDYRHFNGNRTHFLKAEGGGGSFYDRSRSQLTAFSTLDYYQYSTNSSFIEGHYEHHFNGFVLNKFPLLRRLKWQTVAGANLLYTKTGRDYNELFVGVENIFKILRIDFASSYTSGGKLVPQFRIGLNADL